MNDLTTPRPQTESLSGEQQQDVVEVATGQEAGTRGGYAPRDRIRVAIACQGGGSHAAYVAGTLNPLLQRFRDDADERLALVALSGTSGGAICAAVAWWGLLTGGPDRAIERLDIFWDNNSALRWGEMLHNTLGVAWLTSMPCDMQWDPAGYPLRETLDLHAGLWPKLAIGPLDDWIRHDYFSFEPSLRGQLSKTHGLDFEKTADAIGRLCSVPALIQDWTALALEEVLGGLPGAAAHDPAAERYQQIIQQVEKAANDLAGYATELLDSAWLKRAMAEYERTARAKVADLGQAMPHSYQDGEHLLAELDEALIGTIARIPRLMLGASDIGSGEFRAFRSDRLRDRGGISIAAIRASAAIPILFNPVDATDEDGRQSRYWDGLFSQNPPIKTFMAPPGRTSLAREFKPDEIWIAQVNPRRIDLEDPAQRTRARLDVFDRRNELSGNLSLFQEIDFIDAVNRLTDEYNDPAQSEHQHVQVLSIPLDDPTAQAKSGRALGFASKLDRSRRLKDALLEHGDDQARKFLAVREMIVKHLNQRDPTVRAAYAARHPNLTALLSAIDTLHAKFTDDFCVFIDEVAIGAHPACNCRNGATWDVTLHWRAAAATHNAEDAPVRVRVVGRLHLNVTATTLANGALAYAPSAGTLAQVHVVERRVPVRVPALATPTQTWP